MGLVKFELKEEHLKLIKLLQWDLTEDNFLITKEPEYRNIHNFEIKSPFGGNDVYEDMFLILIGKTEREVDVMDDSFTIYNTEEKERFQKLLEELPTALDIILYRQSFELGKFKTRYHVRDWVKIK